MTGGAARLRLVALTAKLAVVVAVAVVLMMQMPRDEIVHVVAVLDRIMAAPRSMLMAGLVRRASMAARARIGIRRGDAHVLPSLGVHH
jgi:hypothetical protein